MQPTRFTQTVNGKTLPLSAVPQLSTSTFFSVIADCVAAGQRVSAFFARPLADSPDISLLAVLADDQHNKMLVGSTTITDRQFASGTPRTPQLHLFEREIAEQYGVTPLGHPWLKPVRYHHTYQGPDTWKREPNEPILPAVGDFYRVDGDEIHEVAVGPVHAGIIEPGHFRFQCHGEEVLHLEIALGFQHRGIEQAMLGSPHPRSIHFAETCAGDTTIAHALAYCQIVESLSPCKISARSQALRAVALELERIANHVGDLGALANDVGFLPTASYCGRIRGDFLNMSALLCGSRFGRAMVRPGGVGFDVDQKRIDDLLKRLQQQKTDAAVAIDLLWENQSVMARFENTGAVSQKTALALGLVGPAARACGIAQDVRNDHASGMYRFSHVPMSCATTGDVFARAYVRWLEIGHSLTFIADTLASLPGGAPRAPVRACAPDSFCATLSEGWRGEVCHCAITGPNGHFLHYKIVDPSFHNWAGLAMALRNQQISDFPLCNKSFNLSYCGHDL